MTWQGAIDNNQVHLVERFARMGNVLLGNRNFLLQVLVAHVLTWPHGTSILFQNP
jgi:hypothetical protein